MYTISKILSLAYVSASDFRVFQFTYDS